MIERWVPCRILFDRHSQTPASLRLDLGNGRVTFLALNGQLAENARRVPEASQCLLSDRGEDGSATVKLFDKTGGELLIERRFRLPAKT